MPTCFVMQPFDGDKFDKRYEEVFSPAVTDAGLTPYRVDRDPGVSIPIQDIEQGIRNANICLAEITLDNPNVWFELGFAIACNKEVVLICSDERTTRYPFDIQHRTVINYGTKSPSEYSTLRNNITAKITAYQQKSETLDGAASMVVVTRFEGLASHEVVALAALAGNLENPDDHATMFQMRRDMEVSGYTKSAAIFAVKSLLNEGYIASSQCNDFQSGESYTGYRLTDKGWQWVLDNKHQFLLKHPKHIKDEPF